MEQFYFELSKNTQQYVDGLFTGGMLQSSYNLIKTTLEWMQWPTIVKSGGKMTSTHKMITGEVEEREVG